MTFKNQADYVVQKCGGYTKVSGMLSLDYHLVWGWVNRSSSGHIPAEYQARLIEEAKKTGIEITEKELIFPPLDKPIEAVSA